jgi:carbonic anhydrase
MRGLLSGAADTDDAVAQWLSYANPSRAAYESGHPVGRHAGELGFTSTDQLAMVNVAIQVQTLIRHRVVGPAVAAGEVRVIGLFFDIPSARVLQVDSQSVAELAPSALALAQTPAQ